MTVIITTDLVNRHTADATGNAVGIGIVNDPAAADTAITIQGSASLRSRVQGTPNLGGTGLNFTNTDLTGLHAGIWVNSLDKAESIANGGWRMRIAANGQINSNFLSWIVGGSENQASFYEGFMRWCVDLKRGADFITGTPAALTGIGSIGIICDFITVSTRETFFTDAASTWSFLQIAGGSVALPGQASEIATNDKTNGRGIFKSVQNVYYILGELRFGPQASPAVASEFQDSNEVYVFEDMPVSFGFHKLNFVGAPGVDNNAFFGFKSGAGVDADGSSGNVFKAVGFVPFSVEAFDSNINVGLYGCSFTNPVPNTSIASEDYEALRAVLQVDITGPTFTDETRDANDFQTGDWQIFPGSEAVGDYVAFGNDAKWNLLEIDLGTAGVGGVVVWEYWDGSGWSALTDVGDETLGFTTGAAAGDFKQVSWAIPNNWATTTLGGLGPHYYVRARITTVYSTNPIGDQCVSYMGGRVNLEQPNAEAIRCVFTNMDTISIRNGAILKKSIISNTAANGKVGALDLGPANPAANTVRDLTLQNNSKGLLLKDDGGSPANVSYDLRNFTFSGNNQIDRFYSFDSSAGAGSQYTDDTVDANDADVGDVQFWPSPIGAGDYAVVGSSAPFSEMDIVLSTPGAGTYTLAYEFWNGTSWTAVSGLTDPSSSLKAAAGTHTLTWTRPTTWIARLEGDAGSGTDNKYYLRIRYVSGTVTTNPLATQIEIPGDVRVDFPSASTVTINILEGGNVPRIDNVNASTVNVVANVSVTLTNIQPNTEVRVFNAEDVTSPIDTVEIAGIENTGSPSEFQFSAQAGTVVDIVVHNVNYILPPNNRIKNFTIPAADTSFPITQIFDRTMNNP
jgi:hypothetical protein